MFPGGGANIGTAHGAIIIDTRSLNDAVKAVTDAVNRINGTFNKTGTSGARAFDSVGSSVRNIDNQLQSLTKAAQTLAGVFAGLKIAELGAETSQALVAAQVRFEAITGSASKATAQIGRIRDSAKSLGVPVNQALDTFASIAPLLQKGKSQLDAYVPIMARLAVLEPMQGLEGAAFAIRESLSNINSGLSNFRSLANRFNLSMGDIRQALDASGGDLAVALDLVLNKMGITNASAQRMANTFMAATRILRDEFGRTLSNLLGPMFDALTPLIQDVTKFLSTLNDAVPGAVGFIGTLGVMTAAALALSVALEKVNSAMKSLSKGSTLSGKLAITGPALLGGAEIGVAITKGLGNLFNDARLKSFELADAFNTIKQAMFLAGMGLVDIFFKVAIAITNFISSIGELPERIKNQVAHGKFVTDATLAAEEKLKGQDMRTDLQKSIDNRIAELNKKIETAQDNVGFVGADKYIADLQAEIARLQASRPTAGLNVEAPKPVQLTNAELDARIGALLDLQKSAPDTYQAAYDAFIKETAPVSGYTSEALKLLVERMRVLRSFAQGFAPTTAPETTTQVAATTPGMSEDVAKVTKDYLDDIQKIEDDAGAERVEAEADAEQKRLDIIEKYAEKRADLDKKLAEDLADAEAKKNEDLQDVLTDQQENETKARADFYDKENEAAQNHYRDLEKLQRDHDRTIREAAAHLDAHAIAEENRRYDERVADLEDTFDDEKAKRRKAYEDQLADQRESDQKRIAEINATYDQEVLKLKNKHRAELDELNAQEIKEQNERIKDYNQRLTEIETQRIKEKALRDKKYLDELEEAGDQNAKLLNIMRRGGLDIQAEQKKLIDNLIAQYGKTLPNLGSFLKGLMPTEVQDAITQVEGLFNTFKNLAAIVSSGVRGGGARGGGAGTGHGAAPVAETTAGGNVFANVQNALESVAGLFGGISDKSGLSELMNKIISAAPTKENVDKAKTGLSNSLLAVDTAIKPLDSIAAKITETCPAPEQVNQAANAIKDVGTGSLVFANAVDVVTSKVASTATNVAAKTGSAVTAIQNWGQSAFNAIGSVYNTIRNIINNINALSEANRYVRSGQRVVQQFASGTSGLDETGLFYGHKGEIVINPQASDVVRRMLGPDFTSAQLAGALAGGGMNSNSTFSFKEGAIQISMGDVGNRSDAEIIQLSKMAFTQAINEYLAKRTG